jgi:glycosyltransferase involved in cell wall biosynthesis
MRVTFLILGKYPTQKAYGITTTETIRSLYEMGVEVTVFSIDPEDTVDPVTAKYTPAYFIETTLSKIFKKLAFAGTGAISKISWRIYWRLTEGKNRQQILEINSDIFWVRDIQALRMVPKKSRLVFEVHQLPNKNWNLRGWLERRPKGFVVAPISKQIEASLLELCPGISTCYSPMGIRINQILGDEFDSQYFARFNTLRSDNFKGLRIGYVGKFFPNGYSKGVEDLIGLAILNRDLRLGYQISIKGGQSREVESLIEFALNQGLRTDEVVISGHMDHQLALAEMAKQDVIVLTCPSSPKYVGFPLKALESIATGRIVVAADCVAYRDIFNLDYQPYWFVQNDAASLANTILGAVTDPELSHRIRLGKEMASEFLWERRTRRILNALAECSS